MKKTIFFALSSLLLISCTKNKENVEIIYHSELYFEYIITIENLENKSEFELYKRSIQLLIDKMKEDKSYLELYKMTPELTEFKNNAKCVNIEELNEKFLRKNASNVDLLFEFEVKNNISTFKAGYAKYID